jgi:hypothetical protein
MTKKKTGSSVASAIARCSRSLDICTRSLTLPVHHINQFSRTISVYNFKSALSGLLNAQAPLGV